MFEHIWLPQVIESVNKKTVCLKDTGLLLPAVRFTVLDQSLVCENYFVVEKVLGLDVFDTHGKIVRGNDVTQAVIGAGTEAIKVLWSLIEDTLRILAHQTRK